MNCNGVTYAKWCEEHPVSGQPFSIADIDIGEVEYDIEVIAPVFDSYYSCWHVVDPCNNFAKELQLTYDMAKDRIDKYFAQIGEFRPTAHTDMSVSYGKRANQEYGYDYPLTGNADTSAPSSGAKSETDAVTDTTTVDKDDQPFDNLKRMGDFKTFVDFFIEQFGDCFTISEGMTW